MKWIPLFVVTIGCVSHAMGAFGDEEASSYRSSIDKYEDAIVDLESTYGPYDSRISQELTGLGLIYQDGNDHTKAISSFENALFLTRINEGLHSLNQVVVVEQLIESHIALQHWARAEELHYSLFELNWRNSGVRSALFLPLLTRLNSLHMQAFNHGNKRYNHLVHAHELTQLSVYIIENVYGKYDMRLIGFLKKLMMSNYYFHIYYGEDVAAHYPQYIPAYASGEYSYWRLSHYTENSIDGGADTINRIVEVYEHNEDIAPMIQAEAKIHIADWEMMMGSRSSAMLKYEKIYQDLWSIENIREDLATSLAEPKGLPDKSLITGRTTKTAVVTSRYFVRLQFDVSASGNFKNVEILDSNPEVQALNKEAEKKLRQVKYRPRMAKGRPVPTERVVRRLNVKG